MRSWHLAFGRIFLVTLGPAGEHESTTERSEKRRVHSPFVFEGKHADIQSGLVGMCDRRLRHSTYQPPQAECKHKARKCESTSAHLALVLMCTGSHDEGLSRVTGAAYS